MKLAQVRRYALGLGEVTEEPHHNFSSFRVRGKIFVTIPPDEVHVHVFPNETTREQALAVHPEFVEKLLWGAKAVGVRVKLADADAGAVNALVHAAWQHKGEAPASKAPSRQAVASRESARKPTTRSPRSY